MILPTIADLREGYRVFIDTEKVSFGTLLDPRRVMEILLRYRFLHFLIVGGGGAVLGLASTWILTEYVFGLERYFTAYLIGTALALTFNFSMYTVVIFRTSGSHFRRLVVYAIYILIVIGFQATIVRILTPFFGLESYLLVIAGVIGAFSIVNFLVFRLSIFKERALV